MAERNTGILVDHNDNCKLEHNFIHYYHYDNLKYAGRLLEILVLLV